MRAVVVREHGPLEQLRIESVPDPEPGANEVLIATRAIGLNYADTLVIAGTYQTLPLRPFSPGKELAGVVRAVGSAVTTCRPGDRVMAVVEWGACAELVCVPQAQCFALPAGMTFAAGAALGLAYQTAHFALMDRAAYRTGETVLVTGASGGVGLACVQVAKALGANVVAGVTTAQRGDLARRNGADHIVDLQAQDLRNALRAQAHAITRGRGVDIVLDPVGGDVFDAALRALAWRGRAVVIGFTAGRIPEVKANYLLVKNIAVAGLQVSDYRDRDPGWMRSVQLELLDLAAAGRLRPHISRELPLEQAAAAYAAFGQPGVEGKIVLVP